MGSSCLCTSLLMQASCLFVLFLSCIEYNLVLFSCHPWWHLLVHNHPDNQGHIHTSSGGGILKEGDDYRKFISSSDRTLMAYLVGQIICNKHMFGLQCTKINLKRQFEASKSSELWGLGETPTDLLVLSCLPVAYSHFRFCVVYKDREELNGEGYSLLCSLTCHTPGIGNKHTNPPRCKQTDTLPGSLVS